MKLFALAMSGYSYSGTQYLGPRSIAVQVIQGFYALVKTVLNISLRRVRAHMNVEIIDSDGGIIETYPGHMQ